MADTKKKTKAKPKKTKRFLVGGNLSDGTRFEAGQIADKIPAKDEKALKDIIVED